MAVIAKVARFKRELKLLEEASKNADKKVLRPRDRIRIRLRCRLCGRPRANYRKFGVCRICFRELASSGQLPGLVKASW